MEGCRKKGRKHEFSRIYKVWALLCNFLEFVQNIKETSKQGLSAGYGQMEKKFRDFGILKGLNMNLLGFWK